MPLLPRPSSSLLCLARVPAGLLDSSALLLLDKEPASPIPWQRPRPRFHATACADLFQRLRTFKTTCMCLLASRSGNLADIVDSYSAESTIDVAQQMPAFQPTGAPSWMGLIVDADTNAASCSAIRSQLAYEQQIDTNLTTLSTSTAALDSSIQGLLFVPDITSVPSCDVQQYDSLPRNVTRKKDLPPANFNLVAIAPWFSSDCTQAYLNSALQGPVKAFIFYKPNNSTNKPQDGDSPVWNLGDGGAWRSNRHFPVFAIPGLQGQKIITQLSLYSGSITQVPHGQEVQRLYNLHGTTYLRIWTKLTLDKPSSPPATWAFILIVIGALLFIILTVSIAMHFIQRRNRNSLKRRVQSGEVDLEAMGIKRVTVPASHVAQFPLFTYNAEPDSYASPSSPRSQATPSGRTRKTRKKRRREPGTKTEAMAPGAPSVRSIRSKRSSLTGTGETMATNFQPTCHICLASFEHRVTVIRELPCGHIFHSECIDEFLIQNSSLCPTCKHCMLPRGYSPKVTNGMVRRERALRRLRERVDLEELSLESGDTKLKAWGKKLFSTSHTSHAKADVQMKSLKSSKHATKSEENNQNPTEIDGSNSSASLPDRAADSATPDSMEPPHVAPTAATTRPRKPNPRMLKLLPTQPENAALHTGDRAPNRRGSPSAFARERMREIADNNAPFDDPDKSRPRCESWFASNATHSQLFDEVSMY
ncbi:RING finger domain-containing protein [Metarhizium album ARSEF 1941]|uniref:RING finger domain-containing protein n=1 Tax=Metarhizium album (strain ARSEF 1941) TaxID=1081103 RepID=A0A0B2X1F6_METAS|nr:RING finger domain-containing protein [Metarhizium album ARSEF 1941]KHN98915.1 RING finger domain-containing protein [Metarhizium album ARSEF 1941]